MEKRNDFVIAYNTSCGDTSLFSTVAHWALLGAFLLIVVLCLTTRVEATDMISYDRHVKFIKSVSKVADRPLTEDEILRGIRLK